jgi:hypothetical protein
MMQAPRRPQSERTTQAAPNHFSVSDKAFIPVIAHLHTRPFAISALYLQRWTKHQKHSWRSKMHDSFMSLGPMGRAYVQKCTLI